MTNGNNNNNNNNNKKGIPHRLLLKANIEIIQT